MQSAQARLSSGHLVERRGGGGEGKSFGRGGGWRARVCVLFDLGEAARSDLRRRLSLVDAGYAQPQSNRDSQFRSSRTASWRIVVQHHRSEVGDLRGQVKRPSSARRWYVVYFAGRQLNFKGRGALSDQRSSLQPCGPGHIEAQWQPLLTHASHTYCTPIMWATMSGYRRSHRIQTTLKLPYIM